MDFIGVLWVGVGWYIPQNITNTDDSMSCSAASRICRHTCICITRAIMPPHYTTVPPPTRQLQRSRSAIYFRFAMFSFLSIVRCESRGQSRALLSRLAGRPALLDGGMDGGLAVVQCRVIAADGIRIVEREASVAGH